MKRYQPCEQVRNGVLCYGIVDCVDNVILDYWFHGNAESATYRDNCMRTLNINQNSMIRIAPCPLGGCSVREAAQLRRIVHGWEQLAHFASRRGETAYEAYEVYERTADERLRAVM